MNANLDTSSAMFLHLPPQQAARDAARALEDYRKVWEFGRTWDGDAYAAQPRGLAEVRDAAATWHSHPLTACPCPAAWGGTCGKYPFIADSVHQPRHLQIRRDLVIQRSWKGLLERMKTSLVVGCLQVRGPL